MALKIVGSGLGRTGTKSMQSALNMLGFGPCHHMVEVFAHPESMALWIAASKGKPEWGAIFDGYNRNGEHMWTTQGMVTEAEPGRAFTFECSMMDFHFSTWGYRIEPTDTGCRVTEWSEDLRPESTLEFSREISGVDDRAERNRQTKSGTLEGLAAALEG